MGDFLRSNEQDDKFNDGFAIPDMRVGFSASYGAWKAKVDMGYAYGKVNMKDVFIQYNFDKDASRFPALPDILSISLVCKVLLALLLRSRWKSLQVTRLSTIHV